MEKKLIHLLQQEADYAVGCTEPGMIALAAAKAVQVLGKEPRRIRVWVSPAIYKNAKAVGIPNTKEKGAAIAAALGTVVGKWELGLRIFEILNGELVTKAKTMVDKEIIEINCDWQEQDVFCKVEMRNNNDYSEVVLKGSHKLFKSVIKNGIRFEENQNSEEQEMVSLDFIKRVSYFDMLDMILQLDEKELVYLAEGARSSTEYAKSIFLKGAPSLAGWGNGYKDIIGESKLLVDIFHKVRILTSIGVSERMAGAVFQVLTSTGSGNNGLLIGVPLTVLIDELKVPAERVPFAYGIAHFTNMYIKAFSGKVSPLCGAVSGGAGVAAAACWLLGGSKEQIGHAVSMLLGNLTYVLCDGAKISCANKLGTAAEEAILTAYLVMKGLYLEEGQGVIAGDVDETIHNVGFLSKHGLKDMDRLLIQDIFEGTVENKTRKEMISGGN